MAKPGGISNLRVFLHEISENLVSDEVAELKFLCGDILTKKKLEDIKNARELFVAIGEVIHEEAEQLQTLKVLFKTIGRLDLKSKILEFEKSRKAEVRDTNVGQHEEIGNDAAPDPVPFQFSDDRHADSRFYQPPQPGPSQPSVLSDYKQVPVTVPEDPATNNEESRNTFLPENKDQPDRGSPNVSSGKQRGGLTTSAMSGKNLPFPWAEENVPVERCISTCSDFVDAGLNKCPLEMSYDCIKSYRGAEELGSGGFGVVYEGTKMFHGQQVVVKEAYDSHCGQVYSSGQLKREKRVGYIKHPHLMPLYAFSEEKGYVVSNDFKNV